MLKIGYIVPFVFLLEVPNETWNAAWVKQYSLHSGAPVLKKNFNMKKREGNTENSISSHFLVTYYLILPFFMHFCISKFGAFSLLFFNNLKHTLFLFFVFKQHNMKFQAMELSFLLFRKCSLETSKCFKKINKLCIWSYMISSI